MAVVRPLHSVVRQHKGGRAGLGARRRAGQMLEGALGRCEKARWAGARRRAGQVLEGALRTFDTLARVPDADVVQGAML